MRHMINKRVDVRPPGLLAQSREEAERRNHWKVATKKSSSHLCVVVGSNDNCAI